MYVCVQWNRIISMLPFIPPVLPQVHHPIKVPSNSYPLLKNYKTKENKTKSPLSPINATHIWMYVGVTYWSMGSLYQCHIPEEERLPITQPCQLTITPLFWYDFISSSLGENILITLWIHWEFKFEILCCPIPWYKMMILFLLILKHWILRKIPQTYSQLF